MPKNKPIQVGTEKKVLMPDGPIYTWSKSQRKTLANSSSVGKDGKQPPHSYLKINEWAKKKEQKNIDKSKIQRYTYIDEDRKSVV